MVDGATGLGRDGFQDWLLQRVSAVILLLYVFGMLGFIFSCKSGLSFQVWEEAFSCFWVQLATFFAVLSLVVHAWVGMWTIATDYLKPVWLRLPFQLLVNLSLLVYAAWGSWILWGG